MEEDLSSKYRARGGVASAGPVRRPRAGGTDGDRPTVSHARSERAGRFSAHARREPPLEQEEEAPPPSEADKRQAEADEMFFSMLRGGDDSAPPPQAGVSKAKRPTADTKRRQRPAWNNGADKSAPDEPVRPAWNSDLGSDGPGSAESSAAPRRRPAAKKPSSGGVKTDPKNWEAPPYRGMVRFLPSGDTEVVMGGEDGATRPARVVQVAADDDDDFFDDLDESSQAFVRSKPPPHRTEEKPPTWLQDEEDTLASPPRQPSRKPSGGLGHRAPWRGSAADEDDEPLPTKNTPPPAKARPGRAPRAAEYGPDAVPRAGKALIGRSPDGTEPLHPDERPLDALKPASGPPEEEEAEDNGERVECTSCGRKFRPDALEKHAKVCRKVFQQKRRAFDSTSHRMPVEALEKTASSTVGPKRSRRGGREPPGGGGGVSIPGAGKDRSKAWRSKSSAFRDAMRAARIITQAEKEGKDIRDLPPMPSAAPAEDMVSCPHCGRTFNPSAAERHIPHCANTKARPTRLIKGGGTGAWKRS
jgi:hypothetical protein